jgi:AraC family transcriptional regulator, transcriptional activator of pobA
LNGDKNIAYFQDISTFLKGLKSLEPQSNLYHIQKHEEVPDTHSVETLLFRTNTFSVSLLTEGEAIYKIGMREYLMQPGSFYFMSPQQLRYYKKLKTWKGYVFVFSEEFVRLFSPIQIYVEYPFFKLDANVQLQLDNQQLAGLLPLLDKMYAYYQGQEPEKLKFIFHYMSLTLLTAKQWYHDRYFNENLSKQGYSLSRAFDDLLEKHFFDIVTQQCEKLFTVSSFALQLHVSVNHLSDTVKKETGKTPAQFIKERTILEAKSLLQNTELSVSEVAYFLTFEDPSYFTKYFKAATGISPSVFKEKKGNL